MSDQSEDLSESLAAELTGSVGMSDQPGTGELLPNDVAADVEAQEAYLAEKDLALSTDQDDTRQGELERAEEAQQRDRKVPLAALHEERSRRQQLELQLQAQQQQLQQLLHQQQLAQQAAQQAQQEAAIPDFDEDPRGYIEAKERQFAQQLEQLKNGTAQQHQPVEVMEAQVLQEAAVLGPVVADAEARFEAANPDYRQAFDHVLAAVEGNMRTAHPGINEQQLGMLRTAALVQLAKQCQAQGVSPAQAIYDRACAMGYQPARQAPRREPPTSLANVHGSARAPDEKGKVTAADISGMTEAEFDKYWNDMKRGSTVRPAV
ncbi:hypothetical protein [Pseudomonas chlororaphis]|uniref:hypothetical protein n=3 Tax=Pseudomonas chlororaphis TaxID=587753 RepID=UPI001B318644|nr:hypothetical protein [Pseudomonas chlororaphis]MBP5057595.1 hypothetical protein [Pseudomonas chlororaphis]MBP5138217.1 hypothetical protein [Pseudomonas chlororaphis]QTT99111.1 hypothetical protein HUT26_07465 [Pseudomonas chlororaphis]